MNEYYLSEKYRAGLSFPGEYLFSLINEKDSVHDIRTPEFPGKELHSYSQPFAVGNSRIIFYTAHDSTCPVLFWFLKFHSFHDGRYVVTSRSLFEEIVIQNRTITRASIQPLPIQPAHNDKNTSVLHTDPEDQRGKEIRSHVKIPRSYMFLNRSPYIKFILTSLVFLLSVFLTLGITLPLSKPSEPNIAIPILRHEYMKVSHIATVLNTLNNTISPAINSLSVKRESVHINVQPESILEISSSLTQIQNSVSMSTILSEIFSPSNRGTSVQGIDVHLEREYFNIPTSYRITLMDSDTVQLGETIAYIRNLKSAIESQVKNEIEIFMNEDQIHVSFEGTLSEIAQTLILIAEWQIPITEFLLGKNISLPDNQLQASFSFYTQLIHKNTRLQQTHYYEHYANRISKGELMSSIKQLFNVSEKSIVNSYKPPPTQQEIPVFLDIVGTVHLKDEKYYSFVDNRNGFTFSLKTGEKYGNWILNGDFNSQN